MLTGDAAGSPAGRCEVAGPGKTPGSAARARGSRERGSGAHRQRSLLGSPGSGHSAGLTVREDTGGGGGDRSDYRPPYP